MSNPFHTASPHRRRFDLCGDHMAAIVLERLTYWWAWGTRILRDGEWRATRSRGMRIDPLRQDA